MQPTIIDDFISKSTAEYIHNTLKMEAILNPKGLLNVYLTERATSMPKSIIDDFISLIVKSVSNQFGFKKDQVRLNRINYQILTRGQELGYHSDNNGAYENTMDYDGYSALLYLTDSYEGGEILFYDNNSGDKDLAKSYHPNAGTLVYFKGDDDYPHSVNEVLAGERANLILFYDIRKED